MKHIRTLLILVLSALICRTGISQSEDFCNVLDPPDYAESREINLRGEDEGDVCLNVKIDVSPSIYKYKSEIDSLYGLVEQVYYREGIYIDFRIQYWQRGEGFPWLDTYTDANTHLKKYSTSADTMQDGRYFDAYQLLSINVFGGGTSWSYGLKFSPWQDKDGGMHNHSTSVCPFRPFNLDFTVKCAAHELGHLFGAEHTHTCHWNGDYTALDGCYPTQAWPVRTDTGYISITCPRPPIPDCGTIMGYCHLLPGVEDCLVLHPQVADTIRAFIEPFVGSCLSTSVPDIEAMPEPAIYPNPTSGPVRIEPVPDDVEVYDLAGRRIKCDPEDISTLPRGVYLYRIVVGGKTAVEKIIKM